MNEICGSLDLDGTKIAFRRLEGAGPAVVWLGGFRSDMGGTKAQATRIAATLGLQDFTL